MYLKKGIVLCFLVSLSHSIFGQTKEETLSYINTVLRLHNNGTMYHSIQPWKNNSLSADITVYFEGSQGSTLHYIFQAQNALYINSSTRDNGVTTLVISFKPNTVKLLSADGSELEASDKVAMEALVDLTALELEKLKKAYKHLIKLYGGEIKDDPF